MRHHEDAHHPDYARIAQLERELGIGQPFDQFDVLLPNESVPQRGLATDAASRTRPAPPPPPVVRVQKPDNVCAFCIQGRRPVHACPFYPACQDGILGS